MSRPRCLVCARSLWLYNPTAGFRCLSCDHSWRLDEPVQETLFEEVAS